MRIKDKIVELLARNPQGLRQADIARALGASRSYVSEVVRDLVGKGIVRKVRENGVVKIKLVVRRRREHYKLIRLGIVWSSEYPFITYFAKAMKNHGYNVDVIVYSNALDATLEAVTGNIDLVLSPLTTQFLYASLTNRIRVIGGGAVGGASVLENPLARHDYSVSSKASTMDLLITIVLREMGLPQENKVYGDSGEEIMYMIVSGRARYAAIWEPLATKLKKMGYREVVSLNDIDVPHCCTLAANTGLGIDVEFVKKVYEESIEEYLKKPEEAMEWYSIKTGIPVSILKETSKNYRYRVHVDYKKVVEVLRKTGVSIPEPSDLRKYVIA